MSHPKKVTLLKPDTHFKTAGRLAYAQQSEKRRGESRYTLLSFVYSSNSERRISDESSNRGQLISFCSKVGFW